MTIDNPYSWGDVSDINARLTAKVAELEAHVRDLERQLCLRMGDRSEVGE